MLLLSYVWKYSFRADERETSNSRIPKVKTELHFKYCIKTKVNKNYRMTIAEYIHKSIKEMISVKGALSGLKQFLSNENPLKMMKNAFYFILKALFVLKIFEFLFRIFVQVGKWLDKKVKVNFKISTSQTG